MSGSETLLDISLTLDSDYAEKYEFDVDEFGELPSSNVAPKFEVDISNFRRE